ncbi:MAG: transposase [Flammeovirgaceae bacterium]
MNNLEPITRINKDIRLAAKTLNDNEARFLVDAYYMMQDNRIRADGQIRSMDKSGEPNLVLQWLSDQNTLLENQIKNALLHYVKNHIMGEWLLSQKGIGQVLAAGLLAHIDIYKAQTAGAIWKYAGLDPTSEWKKGEKRPYNSELKTLCWKIGESFVKVSGHDDAFYAQLYKQKKEDELLKNESGLFAEQAKDKLEKFKIGRTTDAYKAYSAGKLPAAHIHARAKRFAVKIFLSHLHEIWRKAEGLEVPAPFAIAILNHAHKIEPNHIDR